VLAVGILALILGVQNLLLFFGIKLSFTIPIIVGLVAAAWYGGLGPGIFLAALMALISALSNPPAQGITEGQWLFSQISNLALMVFIVYVIGYLRSVISREQEASERYRQLFQNNPFPMWIHDFETLQFLDVNHAAEKTYGYSREEFLKMTIKDIRRQEDLPILLQDLATDNGQLLDPVLRKHQRKDGKLIDVEVTADGLTINGRPARRVLANDVTKRNFAEEALRESEAQFRTLAETASDGIVTINDNGVITFINAGAMEIFGYREDEMLGQNITMLMPEGFRSQHKEGFGRFLTTGQRNISWKAVELPGLHRDGHEIQLELSFAEYNKGSVRCFTSVIRDITRRKEYEEALKRSEEQLRRIIEHSSYGKLLVDEHGMIRLINAEVEKQFGYNREELLGQGLEILIPHRFRQNHSHFLHSFKKNPVARAMGMGRELFGRRKDGSEFPVEIGLNPLTSDQEIMILATITDITERKRVETDLRQSEERYRDLFENNPFPMWVYDAETLDFLAVNDAACQQYGYSSEEFLSMKITQIRPEAEVSSLLKNIAETRGELQKSGDWRHRRKDGSGLFVEITSHEISFLGHSARLVLANDVTARHQADEEIRQLNETLERRVAERTVELESVNKELESFAYSVSHDLRAPLRAMDGFSLALIEDYSDKLDDTGKNFLNRVRTATQQMSRLIDDLLSLSRVTRSEIKYGPVDLSAIANEIIARYNDLQPREGFVTDIQDDLGVYGDERLLRIALENLLGNAWKFTSKTENARISFKQVTENNGNSVYCISDNGAGFDMKYADKLFGAFQRLHSTKEFEGTGIGLATVQRIINRHGGRIWAESEVGKGAAFYFSI
jgi:PAS domain S-box-containing protein